MCMSTIFPLIIFPLISFTVPESYIEFCLVFSCLSPYFLHIKFMMSKFILSVMLTLTIWLRCLLPVFTTIVTIFPFVLICTLAQIESIKILFSSNFCLLILAFTNRASLQQLLCLSNEDSLFPSLFLHLLYQNYVRKSCSFYLTYLINYL